MKLASQKIFITGATGLLGQYFVRSLLQEGAEVWALRRPQSRLPFSETEQKQIRWLEGDLHDPISLYELLPEGAVVIHAAAKVSFNPKDKKELYRTNIQGTAQLVNVCLEKGCSYFLHISSVAALGRAPGQERIDESNQWEENHLTTHYARSKFHAEMEVWRGYAEGLPVGILNPSLILGRGDLHRSSTQLFRYVLEGRKFYPLGSLNYVDVRDVVEAGLLLIKQRLTGERFILNGGTIAYRDFFGMVAEALHQKPPSYAVRPWMSEIAWRLSALYSLISGRPPLVTRETARISQEHFSYDGSKIQRFLPAFRYTPLADTIRWVAASLRPQAAAHSTSMVLSK
jgi:nucleoside-diphosphate-sugar epimerase